MPHFYFHLRTDDGIDRDFEGMTFPSFDEARNDAAISLAEMIADNLKKHHHGDLQGIDITDERGTLLVALNAHGNATH